MTPTPLDLDITALMEVAKAVTSPGTWVILAKYPSIVTGASSQPIAQALPKDAAFIAAWCPDKAIAILTRRVAAEAALTKAEARVAVLEGGIAHIGRVARSDGTRNFDGCILDLQYIDDRCRALASASGEGS